MLIAARQICKCSIEEMFFDYYGRPVYWSEVERTG